MELIIKKVWVRTCRGEVVHEDVEVTLDNFNEKELREALVETFDFRYEKNQFVL